MSSSRLFSEKSWLMPPMDGMNSIAEGSVEEMMPASWKAPLGRRIHLPGACFSAAASRCLRSHSPIIVGGIGVREGVASIFTPPRAFISATIFSTIFSKASSGASEASRNCRSRSA